MANIRQTLRNNSNALRDGGLAGLVTLAATGSKAQAAMSGLGQVMLTKVLGPLGLVAGLAAGATRSLVSMTKAWAEMGTVGAKRMETLQTQLRVLLKGLDAAKQRVRALKDFAIESPYKLKDIVAGDRALQSLTKGALNNQAVMRLIGDTAAQAGVDFGTMAEYVGRLYDQLKGGRPIGEVMFRLQELGVITGEARTQIEKMQESGAGFTEVWRVVEGQLKRSAGTMQHMSKTMEGLESTLEDTDEQLKGAFSTNFIEGQKAAIEANIQTLENLKPAVEGVGRGYGELLNTTSPLVARFKAWATGLPGMVKLLEFFGRAALYGSVGVTALSAAIGGLKVVAWAAAWAKGAGLVATGIRGIGVAAAGARSALLLLTAGGGALLLGLTALFTVWAMWRDKIQQTEKAMREYQGATDAQMASLDAQIRAIKTLDQLSQGYVATLGALAQAQRDYARAVAEGKDTGGAGERIARLQARLNSLNGVKRGDLEQSADMLGARMTPLEQARAIEGLQRSGDRDTMTPGQRAASLEAEADLLASRREAARGSVNEGEKFRRAKAELGTRLDANKTAQTAASGAAEVALRTGGDAVEHYRELHRLQEEEKELMRTEAELSQSFADRIIQLQGGLSIMGRYESAVEAVADAKRKLAELEGAKDRDSNAVLDATAVLNEQIQALEALQEAREKLGWTPQQQQEAAAELELLKRRRSDDLQNRPEEVAKAQEAARERRALEMARTGSGIDAKARLAELNEGAAAGALAQVQAERERLDLQRQYQQIDLEIYERQRRLLDREEEVLRAKQTEERNQTAAAGLAAGMDLQARALRLRGKTGQARDMEEQAERLREEASRAAKERELRDQGFNAEQAARMVEEEITRARGGRAVERLTAEFQSGLGVRPVVDSLQRIGGGGLVASQGPRTDAAKMIDRLEKILRAIEAGNSAGPWRF